MYESYLQRHGFSKASLEKVEQQVVDEITQAEKEALDSSKTQMPKPEMVTQGVYAVPR
jgi:TPP-dependent pyruvate/acetoin dehydrogenase alpha subunit